MDTNSRRTRYGHFTSNQFPLLSIDEYKRIPIVSLEQAIEPLVPLLPSVKTYTQMVKRKCFGPADELTLDESASIMLYSIAWEPFDQCLYSNFNTILKTFDKTELKPWLLYLKLFFSALLHLPANHTTVYRGSQLNLIEQYRTNDIITWRDLPLFTTSLEYLKSDRHLHNTEIRTIFTIHCQTIRNIDRHCYFSYDHFLLFLPATKFRVIKCSRHEHDNVTMIKMQEIGASFLLNTLNDIEFNLDQQIMSLSFFRRCWLSMKTSVIQPTRKNDHFRRASLKHCITKNKHSWAIDLDKQNLTDQDMRIIVKYAIKKNHCQRIRLRDNNLTPSACVILSEGLLNNKTLTSLDLRHNCLSDSGVQCLVSSIISSNIETLNLESNGITHEGAPYLAEILRNNRTLTELYLSNNHLADQGVKLIAYALNDDDKCESDSSNVHISVTNQSILQHLYLGENGITDEGLIYICDMLKINRTLTWLWLTGNEISDYGVGILCDLLANHQVTLEWLFIGSNKLITDASVQNLIHMLRMNGRLKSFYINNCNLSETAKRELSMVAKNKKDFDFEI